MKVLKDTYNKDTVTRSEINNLVKKGKIKNPSWLKSDKFKVDRGVYTLNINDVSGDVDNRLNQLTLKFQMRVRQHM